MYCNNCGSPMLDNATVCERCGADVNMQYYDVEFAPDIAETKASSATEVMVWGISSLCLALFGHPFISFILSIVSLVRYGSHKNTYGSSAPSAKAGQVLGIVSLIMSIVNALSFVMAYLLSFAWAIIMFFVMFMSAAAGGAAL